jgi:uncharacterized membrane protein YoaK (UPF0700 family)
MPKEKQEAPKIAPLVYGSYLACFCAGMIDVGSVRALPDKPTPTHVTGPSVKLGMGGAAYLMDGTDQEKLLFDTNLKLCACFTLGTILAGIVTRQPHSRTPLTGSFSLMIVAVVLILGVGLNVRYHHYTEELQHLCGLCMGFQNGVLCAITGFARTTHMSGPLANVGICFGQASNPEKATPPLLFKLKANLILSVAFFVGIVLEDLIIEALPGQFRWIVFPALILLAMALFEQLRERRLLCKLQKTQALTPMGAGTRLIQEELDQLHELRQLGCAGGFADCVANVAVSTFDFGYGDQPQSCPDFAFDRSMELPVSFDFARGISA